MVWNGFMVGMVFAAAFLTILTIPIFGLCGTIIGFFICKQNYACSQALSDIFSKFSVLILWILTIGWLFFHFSCQ